MAVIGFAIAIVLSITIANYFNRRIALLVSIAWTIETIVLLFYPPLIIIQLAIIWVTYILCGKYQKQKNRIEELEDILIDVPITQKEFAEKYLFFISIKLFKIYLHLYNLANKIGIIKILILLIRPFKKHMDRAFLL